MRIFMLSRFSKRPNLKLFFGLTAVITLLSFGSINFGYSSEKVTEPAVPWRVQLTAAQQAAQKINRDALLYDISANVKGSPHEWDPGRTLVVTFYFVTPEKEEIDVHIDDSGAVASPNLEVRPRSSADLFLAKKDQISRSMDTIVLSPREASRVTWADASTRGKELNTELFPLISLDRDGIPAVWEVTYADANSKTLEGSHQLTYRVDANIGTILSTELNK